MFPAEFVTVRVGGRPGEPERLLLIGRPEHGRVQVREWTSDSWNTPGQDRDLDPADVLAQLETAFAAGLSVSEEMYRLRLWLSGNAS